MLALMKRLTQTILGKFIAMIIIAGMAFWGVDQVFNQVRNGLGSDLLAAGRSSVTVDAFDRRIEVMLRNVNQQSDDPITKEQAIERGMVDQVFQLQQSQTTMLGFASKIGIAPSTDAVLAELKKTDAFKNPLTGELDLATYQRVLAQNRFSQAEYEAQLKSDLTLQALQAGTLAGLMPPDVMKAIQTRYLAESRDVAWFILDAADIPEPAAPTEEDVLAFYNENLDALKQPERRSIDLLKVSADDFLSQVEVTDQEIATIYEASKSERFSEPEQRTYVELMFGSRDAARMRSQRSPAGRIPRRSRGSFPGSPGHRWPRMSKTSCCAMRCLALAVKAALSSGRKTWATVAGWWHAWCRSSRAPFSRWKASVMKFAQASHVNVPPFCSTTSLKRWTVRSTPVLT